MRRWVGSIADILASWKLSVALMVLGTLYYLLLAVWATSSPPHVIALIAGMLPFQLLYGLLLANTGFCLWRRLRALPASVGSKPLFTSGSPRWELPVASAARAQALAWQMGFRQQLSDAAGFFSVRQRWAALGTVLFHGAFFLVALGFAATAIGRSESTLRVAVGEIFEGRPDQVVTPGPIGMNAIQGVPAFRVEAIRPEFWNRELLFTRLEADLTFTDGRRFQARINRPAWLKWGMFLRFDNFGYAPRYELQNPHGQVVDAAVVRMNLFPPGQRDLLVAGGLPHRVYLIVFPDYEEVQGQPATRSLNLSNPAIAVRVFRGKMDLGAHIAKVGETINLEGYSLVIQGIEYWGGFTVVRDPGAPVLFLGVFTGFVGLLLKVRGKRAEIVWIPNPEGGGGVLKGWGCDRPGALGDSPVNEVAP